MEFFFDINYAKVCTLFVLYASFMKMKDLLTVAEAAEELGLSVYRIHDFIRSKRLPAEKLGAYYVIKREDLKLVENRTVGRPPKKKE